jgi:hypothetical protein
LRIPCISSTTSAAAISAPSGDGLAFLAREKQAMQGRRERS